MAHEMRLTMNDHDLRPGVRHRHRRSLDGIMAAEDSESIYLSTTGKQAQQMVAPFLHKHIPNQYNPQGVQSSVQPADNNSSTKYCYRHHPDIKCRRQADEPSMDQLQNVS